MDHQTDNTEGFVIKIPTSLFEGLDSQSKETQKVQCDYNFFSRTNIEPFRIKRNSEHGTTEVQSLRFVQDDQNLKIFDLLDAPGLYKKLPSLLDYICLLGRENDFEKRYYAAVAVSELAAKLPFLDLKEAVILPWAKNDDPKIRDSAAIALSQLLNQEHNRQGVITLLNHWINIDNPLLTECALSTFLWNPNSQPNETLKTIGAIIKAGKILHFQSVTELFEIIYDSQPSVSINQLYKWLLPLTDSDLCWMAGLLSLSFIQLSDATKDAETCGMVVEIIFTLWDNPRMPWHEAMQERTTNLMKLWASEAVEKMNKESSQDLNAHQSFFHELYKKYEGKRNRLDFYLQRWEINRAREEVMKSRVRKDSALETKNNFSFRHLIPQGLE